MEGAGYRVFGARSVRQAEEILASHGNEIHYAVIDKMIALVEPKMMEKIEKALRRLDEQIVKTLHTLAEVRSGLYLGKLIRRSYPHIGLIGYSASPDVDEVVDFYRKEGYAFWYSVRDIGYDDIPDRFAETIARGRQRQIFIVHGHDEDTKNEVRRYVEDLGLGKPIVLHDQPNLGRAIIEKFEDYARSSDLAFILLTPDDRAWAQADPGEDKARARQNVIFELGYFLGMFRRLKGRVLLLYKGELELPSDIHGLIDISIDGGIRGADEEIRRELTALRLIPESDGGE